MVVLVAGGGGSQGGRGRRNCGSDFLFSSLIDEGRLPRALLLTVEVGVLLKAGVA